MEHGSVFANAELLKQPLRHLKSVIYTYIYIYSIKLKVRPADHNGCLQIGTDSNQI
jgi:hypothetical protein